MKKRFGRKSLALVLALSIESGSIPIKPVDDLFGVMPVKANAEETGIISGQNDEKAAEGDSAAVITGKCGENATWKLDPDAGKLTISGAGAMDDFNNGYQPWERYQDYITSVEIEKGITSIGESAFYDCASLTSITIPDSVTNMGDNTFNNCTSLSSITIPDSVTSIGAGTFIGCTSLSSITIPDSVTSIDRFAFALCDNLTSITIPKSVTSIGRNVFYLSTGITDVYCYADPNKLTWDWEFETDRPSVWHIPVKYLDYYKERFKVIYGRNKNVTFKATPDVIAPFVYPLAYNSNEQELVSAGYTDFGTLLYSLDGTNYSEDIPKGTNAGTYTVYYKVDEDDYYFPPQTVEVTIADSYTITWKNGDETLETDNYVPGGASPEYNGETPAKDATAEYIYSFIGWSDDTNTYAHDELPSVSGDVTYTAQFDNTARIITGTCGENATWKLDRATGKLTISGTGAMYDYYDYSQPWKDYRNYITSVEIDKGITSIGNDAFYLCVRLTSISIPDSVTSIGKRAFTYCLSLTSISIPDSVTSIGENTFYNCTDLTSISIPDSVTSIGKRAFYSCTSLTAISISDSVTSIGENTFYNCTGLTSISIPSSVTSIGERAFIYCENLTSISIPSSVTSIGVRAFYECTGLTSISISDSVTSIGHDAFYNCKNITDVYCYADPEELTWEKNHDDEFKPNRATVCHVPAKYLADYNTKFGDSVNVTFKGIPAPAVTAPTANTLTYNGNEQELVTAGTTNFGTLLYSLDGINYSADIPKKKVAGTYTVYYKVDENDYYFVPHTVEVTIAGYYTITWKNGDETLETDNYVPGGVTPEYNGTTPTKDATLKYTYSFIGWSDGTNTYALDELPSVSGDVTYTAQFGSTARVIAGKCGENATWVLDPDTGKLTISGTGAMYDYTSEKDQPWKDYRDYIPSVEIDKGITYIGDYAFYKCTNLTSITIPDSVTSIGESTFRSCTGLTSISIPDSVTSIGNYAFVSCKGLTSISIPDSVTSIGNNTFRQCTGLTSISIPDSVTSIGNNTFRQCTGLTLISIPNSVTSIGNYAFASCTDLTSISIPNSVTSIGNNTFYNCKNITDVYCYADPEKLTWEKNHDDEFKPNRATVCHVPAKYLADYNTKFGDSVNVTFKGISAVTAPTANTLSYNSNEQELVTAGSTDFGTLLYSLDGTNYSEDIPKGTDAGTYTVYYKVDEDDYYFAPKTVEVTIADSYTITWKNGDGILETDNFVPGGAAPEYNGTTPTKDATAEYTYSFIGWSDGTNTYAPDELPSVSGDVTYTAQFDSTARDYIITYMVDGEIYDTKTESYGNAISLPDEPSREGYTFSGWQTSYTTMPAQNIEITGTFTKNQDDDPYVDVVQYGDDGDNHFKSGSGRDQLYGGGGNDVLDGGKGDDYLQGDHGDDTYIFRSGYGNDVISESSGNNTVKIYDYSADQMVTTRNAQNDLIIKFKNSEDTLTVTRFFDFNSNRDFNFEFENGTVIGQHDMPVHNSLITGTDENNYLNGTEINDIIDGGLGNDSLNGFGGEDTYIFGRGYGEDMINEWGSDHSFVDLKDINSDAVTVSDQWGSNLLISVKDSEDVLTVSNFKWGQASYTFRFADGAEGYVDRNTWELVLTKQPENNVIVIIE